MSILHPNRPSEAAEKCQLRKPTHLRANDAFIGAISTLGLHKNLKVIYLQNNGISKMENLQFAPNITHLYLQHNKIRKIENLFPLVNLRKLYLGYNAIAVIEGLENLRNLQELHVENENLPPGESLCFDPRSANVLSGCLKVLNVSGNKISSLHEIRNFNKLQVLEAKNNQLDNARDLVETITTIPNLECVYLQGNPVTRQYRYRENLIANCEKIQSLDGKTVTDICRRFMKKFKLEKQSRRTRDKPAQSLTDDITSSMNLPPAFQRSVSRAVFQYPGVNATMSALTAAQDAKALIFPAWRTATGLGTAKDNHKIPRPLWRTATKVGEERKHAQVPSVLKMTLTD